MPTFSALNPFPVATSVADNGAREGATSSRVNGVASDELRREAAQLRREVASMLFSCGGGHYGGSFSVLDILLTLYRSVLRVDPAHPNCASRDRLVLSKGHAAPALYAVLRRLGFVDQPLATFGRLGSCYEGHPEMHRLPGVDFSTGSLGQGLSVALGMALALRAQARSWVVLGDGECQEGQVWEAALLAGRLRTPQLHAIVDVNGYQEWGASQDPAAPVPPVARLAAKFEAFDWAVIEVDGHDHPALIEAYAAAMAIADRPSVVLARTIKGKGFAMAEADCPRFHCTTLTLDEHEALLRSERR